MEILIKKLIFFWIKKTQRILLKETKINIGLTVVVYLWIRILRAKMFLKIK